MCSEVRRAGGAVSRREFLAFAWFPLLAPRHIGVAGARFRILRRGRSKRRYLRIHGDEETAREVLERHMRTHRGIAYIVESRTRDVPVEGLKVDPNRMFSRVGAEASLRSLNPEATLAQLETALAVLDRGRERLIRAFTPPRGGLTIALHNNSRGYSVQDELAISDQTALHQPDEPNAFFLCTDPRDFVVLKNSPYNVVLQQNARTPDDGSLSRVAATRGWRYVNLEVALGEANRQREMLEWLEEHVQ
jgi:hypothetical protein